jgi:hypothetical protein
MLRVNNPLLCPTDGGSESREEKAEKNENAELRVTIWTMFLKTFFPTHSVILETHYYRYKKKHRSFWV